MVIKLWRPVGEKELALVEKSNWKKWPPRLPEQPIFYPVLNFEYAEKIARDWNSNQEDHNFLGYVTEFSIDKEYVSKFEKKIVGGQECEEIWVPAEELEDFNSHIVGPIKLVATYRNKERIS